MSFSFLPRRKLIHVRARLDGPTGIAFLLLALDTGATRTLIDHKTLLEVGYDPAQASKSVQMITGSRAERVSLLPISTLTALGQKRTNLVIACHTLPISMGIDGLLGLDFFRGLNLNIDFRTGLITLS